MASGSVEIKALQGNFGWEDCSFYGTDENSLTVNKILESPVLFFFLLNNKIC